MANKSFQFLIDTGTATNNFSCWWAFTRVAKQCGWRLKAYYTGQNTTVAAGSNGQALPGTSNQIVSASASGFSTTGGMLKITTTAGVLRGYVTYTGISSNTFTGCQGTSGGGNMTTGDIISEIGIDGYTTANGAQTPTGTGDTLTVFGQATTPVTSSGTMGFNPAGGTALHVKASTGVISRFTYTGITATTLTGCNGLPSAVSNGDIIMSDGSTYYDGWATSLTSPNATPTADSYPTALSAKHAWVVLQGPDLLLIPIAAGAVPGLFSREAITQATSGATGELVSIVNDLTNPGWAIVWPRTGTFDATHTITGAVSGATFTPSSAPKHYAQEFMIRKDTTVTDGQVYYVCADRGTESTSLFSYLATLPNVALTVAPGNGIGVAASGNLFPTVARSLCGTGGATTVSSGGGLGLSFSLGVHCCIFGANATPSAGTSADGSIMMTFPSTTNTTSVLVLGICVLDNPQPGDVNPYALIYPQTTAFTSFSRTVAAPSAAPLTSTHFSVNNSSMLFGGNIARGVGGTPGTIPDVHSYLKTTTPSCAGGAFYVANVSGDQVRVRSHPSGTAPPVYETLPLGNDASGTTSRKGNLRWMIQKSLGGVYATSDAGTWVCVFANSGTTVSSVWIGPHDNSYSPGPLPCRRFRPRTPASLVRLPSPLRRPLRLSETSSLLLSRRTVRPGLVRLLLAGILFATGSPPQRRRPLSRSTRGAVPVRKQPTTRGRPVAEAK